VENELGLECDERVIHKRSGISLTYRVILDDFCPKCDKARQDSRSNNDHDNSDRLLSSFLVVYTESVLAIGITFIPEFVSGEKRTCYLRRHENEWVIDFF
jgi:hypothetical protein